MQLFTVIIAVLGLISLGLILWQWWAARRFPLHQRVTTPTITPSVSILKPLKGVDTQTIECLRSWLKQEYPGSIQVLFGVAAPDDPVCSIVRQLIDDFPAIDAELVVCSQSLGPNAKVSTLTQLQRKVKYEIIIISDADVMVPADLLTNVVSPLQNDRLGLVTCFYRLANAATLAMQWEAIAINADFWSQVLQAQSIKRVDFALGAVMATRGRHLSQIGGFAALVDYLADDYQLGARIAQQNLEIHLCPVVVDCWSGPMNWSAVWRHQLRWARTIRISKPVPYFFSILSNATLWPLAWLLAAPSIMSAAFLCLCFFVRTLTVHDQLRRLTQRPPSLLATMMAVPKDLLNAAIWIMAFSGNTIEWRGQQCRVLSGGKLVSIDNSQC